jgi:hypothetical protein
VRFKGGAQQDSISIGIANGGFAMDGTLRLRADAGAGNDVVVFDFTADATSPNPQFDVSVTGGPGNDTVNGFLFNNGPGTAANYGPAGMLLLDGGTGSADKCTIAGNSFIHRRNCELYP